MTKICPVCDRQQDKNTLEWQEADGDPDLCIKRHSCVKLLPDFIRKYNGRLIISESNYRQVHIKEAVQNVIDSCQKDAISIEENER